MKERRQEKRISVDLAIAVVDAEYDERLGVLSDISPKGIRVRGKEPVEIQDELRLRLDLPEPILGKRSIEVTAVCVWSAPESGSGDWLSGFRFSHVSQTASSVILGLALEVQRGD